MTNGRPSFFIVGAPRCGTTSLTHFLATHPGVFVPEIKVPMHFGRDLDMPEKKHLQTTEHYLDLFTAADDGQLCGESSVFYLYSQHAAAEIKAFDPDAKIIIMLRKPVDMMYSMHARNLLDGNENQKDFEHALALEEERFHGRSIPRSAHYPQALFYRRLARFHDQVKRFFEAFPEKQIHIILMDDIKRDTQKVFDDVLRFLGLDQSQTGEAEKANSSVSVRSTAVTHFLKYPPRWFHALPQRLSDAIRWRLTRWNLGGEPRPPMPAALRTQLTAEFRDDVAALGKLIGRDLSHWSR